MCLLTLELMTSCSINMPKNDTLQNMSHRLEEHLAVIESVQRQLAEMNTPQLDEEDRENRARLIQEVREQAELTKTLRQSCEEVLSRLNEARPQAETVRKLSEQLKLTAPREDRKTLMNTKGDRVLDTCEWLVEHSLYLSWLKAEPPFLWLSGEPGKGKTMLSIFLSERLGTEIRPGRDNTHLIYYFCSQQDKKRNSAAAVLRGLLWQLSVKPAFTDRFIKRLATHDRLLLSEPDSLWKLFAALMEDFDSGKVYCVLDGLDECDEESRTWLAKKPLSLFSPGARVPDRNVLRLLLIGRDIPGFKLDGQSARMSLDADVPSIVNAVDASSKVNEDIVRVISARVKTVPGWDNFSDEFKNRVHQEVTQGSAGSFLQVELMMKEVSLETTSSGVLETLAKDQSPSAHYSRAILRISADRRPDAVQVLRWVAIATRPLSLKELANATGYNTPAQSYTALEELAIRKKVATCSILLNVHDDTVRLSHSAVRDYLLHLSGAEPDDVGPSGPAVDKQVLEVFRLDEAKAHLEVALRCLQLIKESHLQHRIPGSEQDHEDAPLLQYAILNWPLHARHAGEGGSTLFTSPSFVLKEVPSLRQHWWSTYVSHYEGEEWEQGRELSPLHIACRFGIVEWVRALLSNAGEASVRRIIDEIDVSGVSPLAWAAIGGHEAVVDLLLDNGADINAMTDLWMREGANWLRAESVASYGRELKVGSSIWPRQLTALHRAAYLGHASVVALLLRRGANVHARAWASCTPLHAAAVGGSAKVMHLLLEYGGNKDVNYGLDGVLTTPLHYAAEHGNTEAARVLLQHGADTGKRQRFSLSTPLFFAAEKDAVPALVELLLEHGADVKSTRDAHYRYPLHYFCMKHAQPDSIKLLLDHGAKVNALNAKRRTALDIVTDCVGGACTHCKTTTELLLAHGGALKNPAAIGQKNHPELFSEQSNKPLPNLVAPSTTSLDSETKSMHPSIDADLTSLTEEAALADGMSILGVSEEGTSKKDSFFDRSSTQGTEYEGDGEVHMGKRARFKAWAKQKLR